MCTRAADARVKPDEAVAVVSVVASARRRLRAQDSVAAPTGAIDLNCFSRPATASLAVARSSAAGTIALLIEPVTTAPSQFNAAWFVPPLVESFSVRLSGEAKRGDAHPAVESAAFAPRRAARWGAA